MSDIGVRILRRPKNPIDLLGFCIRLTYMHKSIDELWEDCRKRSGLSGRLIENVIRMGHTSVLEHIGYTFIVEGASRSFLTQITRHRMATFTSASQHYQVYSNFDYAYPLGIEETGLREEYDNLMEEVDKFYDKLRGRDMPHYEARQVLPNACRNNLVVTMNARSLFNFINLRMCKRNTSEIMYVAGKMRKLLMEDCPEVFRYSGADCMVGDCRQGKKGCGRPYRRLGEWKRR